LAVELALQHGDLVARCADFDLVVTIAAHRRAVTDHTGSRRQARYL
jgi:hypothetical protein